MHESKYSRGRVVSKLLLVVFAVFVILGIAAWQMRPGSNKAGTTEGAAGRPMQPILPAVAVERAAAEDVDVTFNGLGTVTPLHTVTVRSQVNGQLLRVHYKEGQLVHAGDLLAEIDPRPFQAQLQQYEGQLERDQALLNNARVDVRRYQRLLKEDSIAEQEVVTQKSLVRQYEGVVAIDSAQAVSARLQIQYSRITAPVTGVAGLRLVDPGNYVQTSDTTGLVIITQLQPISVIFTLPEDTLPEIMKHRQAETPLAIEAYDRAGRTRLAQGFLLAIDNQIDPATGTVKFKAQFDNAERNLFPNQFVNVKLIAHTLRGATTLSNAAIQRGIEGTFVYAVQNDQTVNVRLVKLGPTTGERVVVLQGVSPEETIVIDGADKLREHMKVEVVRKALTPATSPPTVSQNTSATR